MKESDMTELQNGPFFNLKAVVQETGLKPDTLRAWERRYGLPEPARSDGGHRLYSRHDIEIIKWLIERQREGLSIKRAVALWKELESEGRQPLLVHSAVSTLAPSHPIPSDSDGALVELREQWVSWCLAFDEQRSEQILAQAFSIYPPELVAVDLLQKGVAEIGEAWYRGEATVQQEHFCSALAIRRLEALLMSAPAPTKPGRIMVACPPKEYHTIGLLLLSFLLRRRGWDVVYLGANVPVQQLGTTIASTSPSLVLLAAQQLHSAASLIETAKALRKQGVPVAYGGLIFNLLPKLRSRVPGNFVGEKLDEAPRIIESLLASPSPNPEVAPLPMDYQVARTHLQERRGLIEAEVTRVLAGVGIASEHISMANAEMALNMDAALALGDIEFVGTDIEWVGGLISNHRIAREQLVEYIQVYRRAASNHLDGRGQPIIDWLAHLTETWGRG